MAQRGRKIKLHFNRVAMQRNQPGVWTAHTSVACHGSDEVLIMYGDVLIGKTIFRPEATQPRAYVQLFGEVTRDEGKTVIHIKKMTR